MRSRPPVRVRAVLLPLLLALLAGGLSAQAPVGAQHAKLLATTGKKLAKQEAKLSKLQAKLAAAEAAVLVEEAALLEAQATLGFLNALLAIAQADLDQALALPEDTQEQVVIKSEAVKLAVQGVKLANKEVLTWSKAVAKHQTTLVKLAGKILKLQDKIAVTAATAAGLAVQVELLAVPFDHDPEASWPLALLLRQEGALPVAGARVMVLGDQRPPEEGAAQDDSTTGTVYWQGFTDAAGLVAAQVRLPDDVQEVDVLVHRAGLSAPWSEPALQLQAGPFAPSLRVHRAPAQLGDLQLVLTPELP